MFDFIDDNKYFLTDNRTAFIQHDNRNSTFTIEGANLPFSNWVELTYNRLSVASNVFAPFTLLEKIKSLHKKRPLLTGEDDDKDCSNLPSSGTCDIRAYKRQKLEESEVCFEHIKSDSYMKKNDKTDVMNTLINNVSFVFVEELARSFTMSDGEYLMERLSDEQKGCLYSMLEYAYPQDFNDIKPSIKTEKNKYGNVFASIPKVELANPFYKIFIIEGSAGCGKSAIIESLNFYSFKRHNNYTKLLYVTQTNVLCQSMNKKCFYNNNMQYLTFYKFLSILNLNYFNTQQLLLNCDALKVDSFQNTCGTNFLKKIKSVIRLPQMPEADFPETFPQKPRLFVIFDEVYTLSKGKLSLFLFMVRCLKKSYPKLTIYCILIGDKYQLRPFTKIENIKLTVVKEQPPKTANNIKKEPLEDEEKRTRIKKEEVVDDLNTLSMISQSESIHNATKFFLGQQFRIVDPQYNDFVNRVRDAENRVDMGVQILREFNDMWGEKVRNTISIKYPIEDILKILDTTASTDYKNIVLKFSKAGMFNKTIDTTVFCFTNVHAHYYNIALAFSYWNQIQDVCGEKKTNFFISFSVIYNFKLMSSMVGLPLPNLINKANQLMNMLPLIRYCPYKVLSSNYPVARLSIVYILDWIFNSKNEITSVVVFSPDTNVIFSMLPGRFDMNLLKTGFGFPLQFAFSSTFASSQGLTLNNKIAISCNNISKAELYVCLTRIKAAKDLVCLY